VSDAAPRGLDIVCVGFAEWDTELWTNQHHLMARLAAGNRVLFVESLGLRRPTVSSRDLRRIARRLVTGLRPARAVGSPHGGEVWVLSPLVLPLHSVASVRRLNGLVLRGLVRRALRRAFPATGVADHAARRRVLWGYVPQAEVLLDAVAPDLVVYHCVDDIAAQDGIDADGFRAAERRFAARADLVLASAPALADRMRELSGRVLLAPNVADTAAFARALDPGPIDPALGALPEPRLVFTGAIAAKKLDLDLLAGVARARPEWTVALVGPVGLGDPGTDVSALAALPNVHLLGARSHDALPQVLRGADVALIPYRRSALTDSIHPMKVDEYLAAGVPVVATPLPALRDLPAIAVADGVQDTVAAIEAALSEDDRDARLERSRRACARSWDTRLAEIGAEMARGRVD
jgi:glycosyltransferase involved in cell wall biosynthesis